MSSNATRRFGTDSQETAETRVTAAMCYSLSSSVGLERFFFAQSHLALHHAQPLSIMENHVHAIKRVAAAVRGFSERGESYRIFHGSSNSTRPPSSDHNVVDISALSNVVSIDTGARVALVEPNVPMDRLVEATLRHGLIPPVVMEFPGITAGGGFSGTSGESSSFRHGFFDETINSVEMILGNGQIVKASRNERADLFHGAAGAVGTLGIMTLMELRLIEAKKFVRTTYHRVNSTAEAVARIQVETSDPKNDYIDGILFSKDHGVIITGQLTNNKPANRQLQTFSDAADPWFYLHVQDKTQNASPHCYFTDYIPLTEYLFRYDRAGFWVGRQGYTYFKYIPFNSFFRWFLDDFSHTRMLYHALHAGGISSRFIVQDLALPYDTAETFINYAAGEFNIWPLWLCPLRETPTPTFHPVTCEKSDLADSHEKHNGTSATSSRPMLNIGVWGWGPQELSEFVLKNRVLEDKLRQLGGRKWLYAHCYYTEDEFWDVYDRSWYHALREKYSATTLPTVFDKVNINIHKRERNEWTKYLINTWPIGGLYGMWVALLSGDYRLHRNAQWKYKGGEES
ncbi:Delta24-sterol reductase [Tolypocladium capitatum]|uniref:Delta(24)-sterol reductase n=1 Tax=Tolypocladium capitatum TaxID=45235 RepID=A0A2K3QKV2_9HYPO|nr:Delta24-sterol reductase [Tolypocladium capitatum]